MLVLLFESDALAAAARAASFAFLSSANLCLTVYAWHQRTRQSPQERVHQSACIDRAGVPATRTLRTCLRWRGDASPPCGNGRGIAKSMLIRTTRWNTRGVGGGTGGRSPNRRPARHVCCMAKMTSQESARESANTSKMKRDTSTRSATYAACPRRCMRQSNVSQLRLHAFARPEGGRDIK